MDTALKYESKSFKEFLGKRSPSSGANPIEEIESKKYTHF
jgi:hypothetical protein